jgi:NADPH-dependent 2,4-dienoyl-CoA reductase/sulfur reductase-like enzyme
MTTKDGYTWRPSTGVQAGLETDAVVSPQERITGGRNMVYDVIVIGAGYAGLAAARDLTDFGECRAFTNDAV